jgi:hypothetical protein
VQILSLLSEPYRAVKCRDFVGKPEGKIQRGIAWHRYDIIKMELKYIEWEGVDWNNLAQDRDKWWSVVNTVRNRQVHKMPGIS